MMNLMNKWVKVIQDSRFKYEGYVEDETDSHIWLTDHKTNSQMMLKKDTITHLEVIEK